MATESGTTTGSTVRIPPRPAVMFAWPAVFLAVTLAVRAAALSLPPDQRHMGITPIACLTAALPLAAGVLIYFGQWRPTRLDLITAEATGLQLRSRKHGDRDLSWSQVTGLGWLTGRATRTGSGLIGKLGLPGSRPHDGRPMWLCNPAGRVNPREAQALRQLAEAHGVAWNIRCAGIDIDSGLAARPWWRRLSGRW